MILITGALGFIGGQLVSNFYRQGRRDIILVDTKDPRLCRFDDLQYINAYNLFDEKNLIDISKLKIVYHLGACSNTMEESLAHLVEVNLKFSQNLFHLCSDKKIPFVYASSAATYGLGEKGFDDRLDESELLRPLNPYATSKYCFDRWFLRNIHSDSLQLGFKFFNVFGEGEKHKGKQRSMVNQIVDQLTHSGKVKLFKCHHGGLKDGEQKRDFIYVQDIVRLLASLEQEKRLSINGIYNLGTGTSLSFNQVARLVAEELGTSLEIEYFEMPEHITHFYQDFTQANMSKFKQTFPEVELRNPEKGVRDYLRSNYPREEVGNE